VAAFFCAGGNELTAHTYTYIPREAIRAPARSNDRYIVHRDGRQDAGYRVDRIELAGQPVTVKVWLRDAARREWEDVT